DLAKFWSALADDNPKPAYRAIWHMAAGSRQAVPYLKERLHPATPPDPQRLQRLVTDLSDRSFAVPQKATQELEQWAELAEPVLQKALAGKSTLDLQQRIQALLDRVDGLIAHPDQLRALRSIQILEYAATADAKELLSKLAEGTPEARLTQEAKASLDRLSRA